MKRCVMILGHNDNEWIELAFPTPDTLTKNEQKELASITTKTLRNMEEFLHSKGWYYEN